LTLLFLFIKSLLPVTLFSSPLASAITQLVQPGTGPEGQSQGQVQVLPEG
jgi:hypothetical protein